ncbi:hypothetical protein Tco_0591755, partial [Tanacetum coccineum]
IEKYKVFSIVSELVYDIIYKNSKKEKRVMRHQEVHKFCDAILKRVLEGLKSYNNDVKYGYSIPKRIEEEYHAIKDDTPLVTTRKEFVRVDVLTIQPESVESTQGTHRKPIATRTPNLFDDVVQKKRKGKQFDGETSTPRKSLKITIKQQKFISTTPLPPSDDQERDDIHKATLLSLALHKIAKIAEEQENMAAIEKKILEVDVDKLVQGEDEESYASEFDNSVFLDEEDFGTRIEHRSHKEIPEEVDDDDKEEKKDDKKDDDDNDDHNDHALVKTQVLGSSDTRTQKMQTPIPSPTRSPRTNLSSDKAPVEELAVFVTPTPATSSQRCSKQISSRYTHISQALRRIVYLVLNDVVPKIASNTTNDLIDDNIPRIVANVSILDVHHTTSASTDTTTNADLQQQLYLKMKSNLQDQVADLELWEILRANFEKSSTSAGSFRDDAFRK